MFIVSTVSLVIDVIIGLLFCFVARKRVPNLPQYFVETKASSSVMEHLCALGIVRVKGNPGDGKTTLSVFIMNY